MAEYEAARGAELAQDERSACGVAFAQTVAYVARCNRALGRDERKQAGTFQNLVAVHGAGLAEM